MKLTIATGMCCDSRGEESDYPQVGGLSSSERFQSIYWRCVCVFFASSVRHNPDASHILFTNAPSIPDLGRFATSKFLKQLGVEVVTLPFSYAPPAGYYNRWRSTFYLFDILRRLAEAVGLDDQAIVCDTDCLFIKPACAISKAIESRGLLAYDCNLPAEKDINGLTRVQLGALFEELGGGAVPEPPRHYGAEIVAADGIALRKVVAEVEAVWDLSIQRFEDGRSHFNTEEHFLSFIYRKLGYAEPSANLFIKRIWTGRENNCADSADYDLAIWHVPREKKYGITRLFGELDNPRSRFWQVPPGAGFARHAGAFLGIPARSPAKAVQDILTYARYRAEQWS
ncbi:MAG TPA: hypothetical protein VFW40_04280 [Capsulimonadaceae bacterium]|nr:hypothetical protein [Capsulimonadaceae bacterium]